MVGNRNFEDLFFGVKIVAKDAQGRFAGGCAEDFGNVGGQCNSLNGLLDLHAVLVKKFFDEGDDERFGMLPSLRHDFAVGGVDEDFRADNGRIFRIVACARVDKA